MEELRKDINKIIKEDSLITNGYLNLNVFSALLFDTLEIDKHPIQSWYEIHDLFIDIITKNKNYSPDSIDIKRIPHVVFESNPQIYPNQKATFIFKSELVRNYHDIIQNIGYQLLEIDPLHSCKNYGYWLTKDFDFTFKLLKKLSEEIIELIQESDKSKQFSHTCQAMHVNSNDSNKTSEIKNIIKHKEGISNYADGQIKEALKSGFYLEAITLQESRLSDRLALYLSFQGDQNTSSLTFNKLIQSVNECCKPEFYKDLDSWRKLRNECIHGMVRSSINDNLIDVDEFKTKSKSAASLGQELVTDVDNWFEDYVYNMLSPFKLVFAENFEEATKVKDYFKSSSIH